MMFRPRESHDLRLVSTRLDILPRPSELRWLHDVFDNSVAIATFDGAARRAALRQHGHARAHRNGACRTTRSRARRAPIRSSTRTTIGPTSSARWRASYPWDDLDPWTARFLAASGSTTTMTLLHSMTRGIKDEFVYVRRTREGRAESRRDAAAPQRQLPRLRRADDGGGALARHRRPFRQRLHLRAGAERTATAIGGGSTHAWMQVYLPGAGWVDFDPTNSIVGNRNLIRVAVAWDQRNALPLWGTFIGPSSSFCGMDVDVSVVEASAVIR